MSRVDNYLMKCISGLIQKTPDIHAISRPLRGLPFTLHNFSKGNVVFRRPARFLRSSGILYHPSRAMGY